MEWANAIGVILVYALICVTLVVCYILRKKNPDANIRKVIHFGIGNFIFIWWIFKDWWVMDVFFTVPFFLGLLYITLRDDGSSLVGSAVTQGNKTGLLFYVLSIMIVVTIFFEHFVAGSIGIAAMVYGDCAGSLIGKRYGKHKIFRSKSLEGTFAVFAVTAIMTGVVLLFYTFLISGGYYSISTADAIIPIWSICLLTGAVTALLEAVSPGEVDNVIISVGITLMLCALGM